MKTRAVLVALSVVALLYFVTSLVVVVNAFVWLPTFPSLWYSLQDVIYWPLQGYFGITSAYLGRWDVSYKVYAFTVWAPFLAGPLAIWVLSIRWLRCRCQPESRPAQGAEVQGVAEGSSG